MTKEQFLEIVKLIFALIDKRIPGHAETIATTEKEVREMIEEDFAATRNLTYELESFYFEVVKLFAGLMEQDDEGKIKHEVKINTDELFKCLQEIYENIKGAL